MIDGKNFKIYEPDDIIQAVDRLEVMALKIKEMVDAKNPAMEPFNHTDQIVSDLFTAIAAAGIGAAVCKHQGGIVIIREDATEEEKREAMKALDSLRPKKRIAPFPYGGPVQ